MANYVPELYKFLEELGRRQDRQWFKEHRGEYDELREKWLADLDCLIAAMEVWWPELRGQSGRSSAFRIYRDTRFSADKRPFKSYFSASFSPLGRSAGSAHKPGLYLQMGPQTGDYGVDAGLYGGIWMPETPVLRKLRKAILDNIEEFEEIINDPELLRLYPDWCADALKTVPKGYDRNHPQAHLLRLKEYGRFLKCDLKYFSDPAWPEKAAADFRPLKPLLDFLDYSINEEVDTF